MDVIIPLLKTINQVNGHGTQPSEIVQVDINTDFETRERGLYVDLDARVICFAATDRKTIRIMRRSIELVLCGEITPTDPTQHDCVAFIIPPVTLELDDATIDA